MSSKRVDAPALTLSFQLTEDEDAGLIRDEAERLADEITQELMERPAATLHLVSPSEP